MLTPKSGSFRQFRLTYSYAKQRHLSVMSGISGLFSCPRSAIPTTQWGVGANSEGGPPCGRQPERAVMRRTNQAWKKEPVAATLYHSCIWFSLRTSSQTSGKTMLNESNSWGNWPLEAIWNRMKPRELVNSLECSLPSPSKSFVVVVVLFNRSKRPNKNLKSSF